MEITLIDDIGPDYRYVIISPHFDDASLSVGGTVLLGGLKGERSLVVSVFTGGQVGTLTEFAEFQHKSWGGDSDVWSVRESEERASMDLLDADYVWLGFPDAVYRGDQYMSDVDLFGEIKAGDAVVAAGVESALLDIRARCPVASFILPLGLGNHVDHQICRRACGQLISSGTRVLMYEDIPYALDEAAQPESAAEVAFGSAVEPELVEFGGLIDRKIEAVELYASQVPWIFRNYGSAPEALRLHATSVSSVSGGHAERMWMGKPGARS